MNSEERAIVLCVAIACATIAAGIFGGVQCSRMSQESFRACVQAGRPPAECAQSTDRIHQ